MQICSNKGLSISYFRIDDGRRRRRRSADKLTVDYDMIIQKSADSDASSVAAAALTDLANNPVSIGGQTAEAEGMSIGGKECESIFITNILIPIVKYPHNVSFNKIA